MENKCGINTADHFRGTIEKAQDSNMTRISKTTNQVSDNDYTQLSEQNEIHTAVDPNASGDITATTTSMPILAEIPLLKRAVGPYKQVISIVLKTPITSLEPRQHEEMLLRLMGRKQIHSDFETVYDLPVERKRRRLSCTDQILPQIEESNSAAAPLGDGQNQRKHGFGECSDESETDNEESEYEGIDFDGSESCDNENGTINETLLNKARLSTMYKLMSKASHKCDFCPYSCLSGNSLKVHMRTHTGERPFKCALCSYAGAIQGNLTRHMRTHNGEKPYKCNLCPYACTQANALQEHIRTHTGEKPYKCNFCSYACTTRSCLTKHMRTHTGDKPFKCSQCSFACAQSGNLRQHMRSRHSLDKK